MSTLNRLNAARRAAAHYAERNPESAHYCDWRNWRQKPASAPTTSRDLTNRNIMYVDQMSEIGLRFVGDAHKIVSMRYTGWYADNDQNDLYVGQVYQLPARNGVEQYVPALVHSGYGTGTLYLGDVGPDKEQAARDADHYAQKEAEESREADAKDQAEQQILEAREEIHRINKEVLPALKDIKGHKFSVPVCSMLRAGILEHLADRRNAFNTIKKLEANFWDAVPQ